jgi:hypothetical protein
MTLTELLAHVVRQGHIRPRRLKDFKTSLRYLAQALGTDRPERCGEKIFLAVDWKTRLNAYFDGLTPPPSPHTVRNTRNNLSALFRQARALGLLPPAGGLPAPAPLTAAQQRDLMRQHAPYPRRFAGYGSGGVYGIPRDQWPPAVRQQWQAYCEERALHLRRATLHTQERLLASYLGFLLKYDPPPVVDWRDLFAVARLDRFVRWQSRRWQVRVTALARRVGQLLRHLARHYQYPEADPLAAYCAQLPLPEPVHDKRRQWIGLRELEQIALAMLEAARPPTASALPPVDPRTRYPGLYGALQHGRALTLRLLVRIPLRQRNIREMRLGRNLYRDAEGRWHLAFSGEELKVSRKSGRPNTFQLTLSEFCPELIPHLEAYLSHSRPRLPNAATDPHVFLTRTGRPHTAGTLYKELRWAVYRYSQQFFYPHLIRTIWATEFIAKTGDVTTAAYMLNDRVETVLRRYQEIRERDHQHKARLFLGGVLPTRADPAAGAPRDDLAGRRPSAAERAADPRRPGRHDGGPP